MKMHRMVTLLIGLMMLAALTPAQAHTWHTDWDAAAKEAKSKKKPILVDFTGSDWCGWCIKLDEEVFETSEFKTWAAKNVVLLKIDFPRKTQLSKAQQEKNNELAQKYGVQGFPTIIFTDAKGEVLGEMGYEAGGPKAWTKSAEGHLKK